MEDLRDLKKLVEYQNFQVMSDGILSIESVKIRYFMSANPIRTKVKILEEYVSRVEWEKEDSKDSIRNIPLDHTGVLERVNGLLTDTEKRKLFLRNICLYKELACPSKLVSYVEKEKILLFYLKILRIQLMDTIENEGGMPISSTERSKYGKDLQKAIGANLREHNQYYEAISLLVDDSLCEVDDEQEKKETKWVFNKPQKGDLDKNKLYYQIKVYTDSRNYFNHYGEESKNMIGFYKDLLLFYLMNTKMRQL